MKTILSALLISLAAAFALHAQSAQLVKDINTIGNPYASSSSPGDFFRYGSRIVFAAQTPGAGRELWTTDGTAAGTSQLLNINPGSSSSSPSRFTIVNGTLVFNARDSRGAELWMSDGTAAGTRLMADIAGGGSSSSPGDRIVFHNRMFFSAYEPVNGNELWITDGTPAGTRFFRDLAPGTASSEPRSFVQFGDAVYFSTGDALWKTDGTEAGTVIVKPGVSPVNLVVAGARLFFSGYTPQQTGSEPWVSDGTEAGTRLLADIAPGTASSMYYGMTPLGDRVLFAANEQQHGTELWISDGTSAGTQLVRDIFPGPSSSLDFASIAVMGGTAYFAATSPATGRELWKSDGTEAGTQLVQDIRPGTGSSAPNVLVVAGSSIFFAASGDGKPASVWVTDGTAGGTRAVSTADPRPSIAGAPAYIDGALYFPGSSPLNGVEPWKTDGTSAGTSMILNLAQDSAPSSEPRNLTAAGGWIYFDAWEGLDGSPESSESRSLWRSDGTPEGTVKLTEAPKTPYAPAGGSLFFSKNALWESDGTPGSTAPAAGFANRFPSSPFIAFVLGDQILASTASGGLYATTLASGAPAIPLGAAGYNYSELAGRALFFVQDTFTTGLRMTDGTAAGTFNVVASLPERPTTPIVVMGGHGYFTTFAAGVTKLWRTDGTYEGTVAVKSLPAGGNNFVAAGTKLFFTVNGQLWVYDGTESGTHALPATPAGSNPRIVAAGDRVVFVANGAETGSEPWVSDGTNEGTHLLRDINAGALGSGAMTDLISVDGLVYTTAFDEAHGSEVWVTDGTTEGTRLAADVEPGTVGSFPRQYARAGDRIYFTATNTATGIELWSLALPAEPRLSVQDVRVAEADSGTSTARFTVRLSAPSARSVTVDYATADGTASAGSDYDAASGTLAFNAGETSKSVDVTVRGDAAAEGNETFFLTLRNAGAPLAKSSAFAIIEDNDRSADLKLALDFVEFAYSTVRVNATNDGPGTATNIRPLVTKTPADVAASDGCCPTAVRDITPGDAPARVIDFRWFGFQQYMTASANARERDPNPSNNRVEWMTNNNLAMDALYLTPGSQANVWSWAVYNATSMSVESTNPAVVSVPATVAVSAGQQVVNFVARGVSTGSAVIRVFTPSGTWGTIKVDVVAPGTAVRWPGAVNPQPDESTIRFDKPATVRVYLPATAPYNGRHATGRVTVTANGRQAGSATLDPAPGVQLVPYYAADVGSNAITIQYPGDENFLPSTLSWNLNATRGAVTLTDTAARSGPVATVRVTVAGSPMASPSGTIKVSEAGVIAPVQAALVSIAPGTAQAEIVLPNVTGDTHTLLIEYSGDARYLPATQNMRLVAPRTRSARH